MNNKPWLKKDLTDDKKEIEVMGAKIKLKTLSFQGSRMASSAAMKVDEKRGTVDVDAGLLGVLRTIYQIDDWDLTGEDDKKLPITLETFDELLSEEFVNSLIAAVNDKGHKPLDAEEKKQ